jgi:hypothetical protein
MSPFRRAVRRSLAIPDRSGRQSVAIMNPSRLAVASALAVAAALSCAAAVADGASARPGIGCGSDCADEKEPFLDAASLVQPALLSGPDYKVVPEVAVRGYMANFLIDTPWGPLRADSVEMLGVRVAEMPALEALDRASRTGAFAHALAEGGKKTGSAIVNVVAHPVDTVTGIPRGVVRYLRRQIDTWRNRAQSLADQTARHAENRGDPFRAPAGPMTAGRDGTRDDDPAPAEKKNRAWYARIGSETGREARRYLKYSRERRAMARLLGIDPSSTNPILDDKLDSLAWAAVGGNFSAGQALAAITGTAAAVISGSAQLNQYVLQEDPEQLRASLRARLLELCSDDTSIRSFLRRGAFTDALRVELTESLERLEPQAGCNDLLELAATTHAEVEARYLVDALKLIRRNVAAGSVGKLVVAGAAVAWHGGDGALLLPLPVDYLSWSHDIDEFFDQPAFRALDKTVLIAGDASLPAQRGMTRRGWNLKLRARYDGAPAYALGRFGRRRG